MAIKVYYDINLANQAIVRVPSKPQEYNAEEAISRIYQLVSRVTERFSGDPELSEAERQLTPGYTLIYICNRQSNEPIPLLTRRHGYNLSTQSNSINSTVKTIISQYQTAYAANACFLRKMIDSFLFWLTGSTPLMRMEANQQRIAEEITLAGHQASKHVDLRYGGRSSIGMFSDQDPWIRGLVAPMVERATENAFSASRRSQGQSTREVIVSQ